MKQCPLGYAMDILQVPLQIVHRSSQCLRTRVTVGVKVRASCLDACNAACGTVLSFPVCEHHIVTHLGHHTEAEELVFFIAL